MGGTRAHKNVIRSEQILYRSTNTRETIIKSIIKKMNLFCAKCHILEL